LTADVVFLRFGLRNLPRFLSPCLNTSMSTHASSCLNTGMWQHTHT
jgi:hypothetical protein